VFVVGFVQATPGAAGMLAVPIPLGMGLGRAALVTVCSLRGMQIVLRGIGWSAGGGPTAMPDDLPPAGPTIGDAQLWGAFRVAGAALPARQAQALVHAAVRRMPAGDAAPSAVSPHHTATRWDGAPTPWLAAPPQPPPRKAWQVGS